jgi:hypothetical protein
MTTSNFNQFLIEGKKMTTEQKLSNVKLSNYSNVPGFHSVIVKRNNVLETIQAFYLNMFEDTFTPDGRLIANRIA